MQSFHASRRIAFDLLCAQLALTGLLIGIAATAITLRLTGEWLRGATGDEFLGNIFSFTGATVILIGSLVYFAGAGLVATRTFLAAAK